MSLPQFTMRQLLEAGVHFGHQSHRWNPKMQEYLFGTRNKIHIIDLSKTVPFLHQALVAASDVVAQGGRILFVGTKRQASETIAEAAKRCAQYYVNHRWLGGMLTNWKTITNSIKRLRYLEELLASEAHGYSKKELLHLTRERDKLELELGGIKDMGGVPDLLFVIDTNKEAIAIAEAQKLKIPIIAVIDSNSSPDGITYPIPGNDDAGRAITLYCDLMARAAIDGIERAQGLAGIDIGAAEEVTEAALEELPAEPVMDGKADGEVAVAEGGATPAAAAPKRKSRTKPKPALEEPAAEPATTLEGLPEPQGEKDDLKKIRGLTKAHEKKLNERGIFHLWQIASFTQDNLDEIDRLLHGNGQIAKGDWVDQARELTS
ncbi:MAG TPA: 30S ribosomal protein S2 [Hyphomicrobiales bacterium]|nr:30S ribosomal protein S2 [Hyphomicrobiales bacterium]